MQSPHIASDYTWSFQLVAPLLLVSTLFGQEYATEMEGKTAPSIVQELPTAEVLRGLERLQSQLGQISGSFEVSVKTNREETSRRVDFAIHGKSFIFSELDPDGSFSVFGRNDRYAFYLTRETPDRELQIARVMPLANEKEVQVPVPSKTGEKESYLPSELFQCSVQMKFIDNCLDLAFAVTTVDLSTVFAPSAAKFKNPKRITDGLWSMDVSQSETNSLTGPLDPATVAIDGRVILDPNRDWAIVRFDGEVKQSMRGRTARSKTSLKQTLKKFGESYIVSQATFQASEKGVVRRFKLLEASTKKLADKTFTLTGYGLPEPDIAR